MLGGKKPGSGSSITAMARLDAALTPPTLSKNVFWQQLNDRLGAKLDVQLTPSVDYTSKVATVIAGGDLPDMMQIAIPPAPAGLPTLLDEKFADLTDYLAGDGVKDYPAFASFPTVWWNGAIYNDRIFGIPHRYPVAHNSLYQRADLLKKADVDPDFANGDEFLKACRTLTDTKKGQWAMGSGTASLSMVRQMHAAPNVWKVADGKFTSAYEDDTMSQALGVVAQMWKDGLIEPDAFSTGANTRTWFGQGKIAMMYAGSDPVLMQEQFSVSSPGYELGRIAPPKWEGGGPAVYHLGEPTTGLTAIRAASASRVQELLRVIDYLAAPFGTDEYLFLAYGVDGHDYTLKGGNPTLTSAGQAEVNPLQLGNIVAPPFPLYSALFSGQYERTWEIQSEIRSVAIADPSYGLYSATSVLKGPQLDKDMQQAQADIIQGRKSVTSWSDAVKQWRSQGGDKIRSEFESAYQKKNS